MTLANEEIRKTAKKAGVPLWAIASKLGISEPSMTRLMRRELQEEKRKQILSIIEQITAEGDDK